MRTPNEPSKALLNRSLDESAFFQKIDGVLRHHDGEHQSQDFHWLVDSFWFNGVCGALVMVNAIILGLETDYPDNKILWMVFDNVFTGLFLTEMTIKLASLRQAYFFDIANWLDATIVVLSVIHCVLGFLVPNAKGKLKNIQILRVLRMVRIIRVIRILRYFRPLVLVVRGVVKAMETTFWVACVLLVSVYCCAIFVTEFVGRGTEKLYPGYSTDEDVIDEQEIMQNFNPYLCFGGLTKSMFTLFNIAIMAEWVEILRPVFVKQPMMLLFFIAFVLFVTLGIMNVIVAMIVDNVLQEKQNLEAEDRIKEKQQKHKQWNQLLELIRDLEEDDHTISIEKLKSCMEAELLFTYHRFDDSQSFGEKLMEVRLQREMKHPEETWDGEEWRKRLDIRDAFGDKVDLFDSNGNFLIRGFSPTKKGLPFFRDAIDNLKRSQFPVSVKIQSVEAHNLVDLLARCDLPEGLSAQELIMMFDSSGDGVLQHHEFLTSFYRLIEHSEFQQIALLQAGLNRITYLLKKNNRRTKEICNDTRMEVILDELQQLRKLCVSENTANNQRYDPSGITSLASLIQEVHGITELRLQSFEEKILKALEASQMCCLRTRSEATKQIQHNGVLEAAISLVPNEVVNLVSDCNSFHKDVDVTCGAISFHGASCTESMECNRNVFQKLEFEMPRDTTHKPSEYEKECESKAKYSVDCFPHDTAIGLRAAAVSQSDEVQQISERKCLKENDVIEKREVEKNEPEKNQQLKACLRTFLVDEARHSRCAVLSCDRKWHALDDTSRDENSSAADLLHCSKLLSGGQYFQYEVVVQDSCSLGCTVTWGYPEIADVSVEGARRDIHSGDVIVECEGVSTGGKSREELLEVFQRTRPLHLTLRRYEACSAKDKQTSFYSIASDS